MTDTGWISPYFKRQEQKTLKPSKDSILWEGEYWMFDGRKKDPEAFKKFQQRRKSNQQTIIQGTRIYTHPEDFDLDPSDERRIDF